MQLYICRSRTCKITPVVDFCLDYARLVGVQCTQFNECSDSSYEWGTVVASSKTLKSVLSSACRGANNAVQHRFGPAS